MLYKCKYDPVERKRIEAKAMDALQRPLGPDSLHDSRRKMMDGVESGTTIDPRDLNRAFLRPKQERQREGRGRMSRNTAPSLQAAKTLAEYLMLEEQTGGFHAFAFICRQRGDPGRDVLIRALGAEDRVRGILENEAEIATNAPSLKRYLKDLQHIGYDLKRDVLLLLLDALVSGKGIHYSPHGFQTLMRAKVKGENNDPILAVLASPNQRDDYVPPMLFFETEPGSRRVLDHYCITVTYSNGISVVSSHYEGETRTIGELPHEKPFCQAIEWVTKPPKCEFTVDGKAVVVTDTVGLKIVTMALKTKGALYLCPLIQFRGKEFRYPLDRMRTTLPDAKQLVIWAVNTRGNSGEGLGNLR